MSSFKLFDFLGHLQDTYNCKTLNVNYWLY